MFIIVIHRNNINKIFYFLGGLKLYLFDDYFNTKKIYHIISLHDLRTALTKGISYHDKITFDTKYKGFHSTIQQEKLQKVPAWVRRDQAIFASINYVQKHHFHADSVVLGLKIDEERCWVANEDLANKIYAPFVLKDIVEYNDAISYMNSEAKDLLKDYWETSLSFIDNLTYRYDLRKDYNAEVLVLHPILPEDIDVEYIISGHYVVKPEEWKEKFC